MKKWIAGLVVAVLAFMVGTMGVSARTVRSDTSAWTNEPTSEWPTVLGYLPTGLLISAPGSTTPVAPLTLTTTLSPSFIYYANESSGVSLIGQDGCQYDAQTYPDALSSNGLLSTAQVTNCNSDLPSVPDCSGPNTSTDYFGCYPVSQAVDLQWGSDPNSPTFEIIYFDLGAASVRNASGYDSVLYDSTYSAITPSGTGTPLDAWEIEFNCPSSGCTTGAALQYGGVIYSIDAATLSSGSVMVTTPSGVVTLYSPGPSGSSSLLNEFVFDGYTLHAPPGWTARNVTTTTIAASPTAVQAGQSVILTATVTGQTPAPTGMVEFDSQGQSLGTVALNNGSAQLVTTFTTASTYMITAVYKGDSSNATSQSAAQSITVTAPPPAPMVTATVTPTSITLGQTATLSWSSTNATTCAATGSWTGTQALQGTATETPTATGSDAYTLNCTGAGGTVSATATLTVNAPAATVSISVSPTSMTAGQSATLSWSSTNATACSASGGWTGSQAISGSQSVSPTASTTYTLTCTGAGPDGSASANLTVTPAPTATDSSGGHSGGGAIGIWELLGFGLIGMGTRRREPAHRSNRSSNVAGSAA